MYLSSSRVVSEPWHCMRRHPYTTQSMVSPKLKRGLFVLAGLAVISVTAFLILNFKDGSFDDFQSNFSLTPEKDRVNSVHDKEAHVTDFKPIDKMVIFPTKFPQVNLSIYYKEHMGDWPSGNVFRHVPLPQEGTEFLTSPLTEDIAKSEFHKHAMKVFHGSKEEFNGLDQCSSLKEDVEFEVSEPRHLDVSVDKIVRKLFKEKDDYLEDLSPLFSGVEKQFEEKTVEKHWFRFAGSSVWLEEYGVHLMISRLLYSPKGIRNAPLVSLAYAQLYNDKWEELDDTELIVPTNNPNFGEELRSTEQLFAAAKYPQVLKIPAFHDARKQDNKFYGTEDPRTILVQNSNGYQEPLVVFNAYHRKVDKEEENESDESLITLKFGFYRSIFVAWPWQLQKGKANAEGILNDSRDDQIYNRIVEMKRKEHPRLEKQKNWAPFISHQDRQTFKHDRYIYFIYRWANLEILRCDLSSIAGSHSDCESVFKMNPKMDENEPAGDLRGGTQLVNINDLLANNANKHVNSETYPLPEKKEIWIGFARAQLKDCGCDRIYRPNVVMITKEEDNYDISHVSSFVSMGIPVLGWDLNDQTTLCTAGPNALIPNGISMVSFKTVKTEETVVTEDYITMAYSVADYTVETINIKGLLNKLFTMGSTPLKNAFGSNNNNVDCAVEGSRDFCKAYGDFAKTKVKTE